jgi:hypothetical protein
MDGLIVFESVDTCEELLDALRPRDPRWGSGVGTWIFRGHAQREWQLTPSALRDPLSDYGPERTIPQATHRRQVLTEHHLLVDFLEGCDSQGLSFPDDTYHTRVQWRENISGYMEKAAKGEVEWPPAQLFSMLALAQHYGVPTRLLDWTTRPLHAAYFAAREAVKRAPTDSAERMVVWGISRKSLSNLEDWATAGSHRISYVSPPPAQIPNVLAQRGVFTVITRAPCNPNEPPDTTPLDEVVFDLVSQADDDAFDWIPESFPWIRAISLPVSEAPRLLRLLDQEHVGAMYLFPGYRGVVEGLEERRLWDGPRTR